MQVHEVLDKITDRNAPVIGCIARAGGDLHHNLDDFGLDCDQIADSVEELLALTDYLDQESGDVDTVYTEFDGHCVIGKRVDDSLLVAVTEHLQRAGFKKLQVGLSLQTRMLTKAFEETPAPVARPQAAAPAQPAPPMQAAAPEAHAAEPEEPMSAHAAIAAQMERPAIPDPMAAAPAPAAVAEEPAKKGKVRKVYRGTVYWE